MKEQDIIDFAIYLLIAIALMWKAENLKPTPQKQKVERNLAYDHDDKRP